MHRIKKLIGIIFILCVVFFIICDEKGIKFSGTDNHLVFNEIDKFETINQNNQNEEIVENIIYKNLNIIRINPKFKDINLLRESNGINEEFLAKLEEEKLTKQREKELIESQVFSGPNIIALNDDTIYNVFQGKVPEDSSKSNPNNDNYIEFEIITGNDISQLTDNEESYIINTGNELNYTLNSEKSETGDIIQAEIDDSNSGIQNNGVSLDTGKKVSLQINAGQTNKINTGNIKILETGNINNDVRGNVGADEIKIDTGYNVDSGNSISLQQEFSESIKMNSFKKYELVKHSIYLSKGAAIQIPTYTIDKYPNKNQLALNLKNGIEITPVVLYKNTDKIKIYSGFKNPKNIRNSNGINEEFLAKQEEKLKGPSFISLKDDTISNSLHERNIENDDIQNVGSQTDYTQSNNYLDEEKAELLGNESGDENDKIEKSDDNGNVDTHDEEVFQIAGTSNNDAETKENNDNTIQINEDVLPENIQENTGVNIIENIEINIETETIDKSDENLTNSQFANEQPDDSGDYTEQVNYVTIEKPDFSKSFANLSKGKEIEIHTVKVEKYNSNKHVLSLRKGKAIKYDFVVLETTLGERETETELSDPMLESLLENEEIDINTLESENDEFLQKVFQETRDTDVMNLIVENYLNEYQFVKAKRFIENLPEMYRVELKPSLNLRVSFNSFALTSKTIFENLTSLVQNYRSDNKISEENKNRYLGVIALMQQDYDHFFEIAENFTTENNKGFISKIQGYKDQISKQMGMPDYYFDTLVSLELFNQGLFQPAKVLALSTLQKNSNYILPYQVLAYANFLTNSRDTSIEYLKKLVDLDPNNAEKYRFLIGVASYRNEKYEQSVVMLSMIKDEKLCLDAQRYLINDYVKLDQKNKLISSRNKLLGYDNLVASDFYTYFYEAFYHPYAEGNQFQIYAFDTELANKMLRVCALKLPTEENVVCTYGAIGKNIAIGQFEGLEQLLLNLVSEYPQGYLYHALGEYYIQQGDFDKAKIYLLKAVSLTQKKTEKGQIKKLLQDAMS